MLKRRLEFFTRTHSDYVIIFLDGENKSVFFEDEGVQCTQGWLEKERVNYLVVDNLEVVKEKKFSDNRYQIVWKREVILRFLRGKCYFY